MTTKPRRKATPKVPAKPTPIEAFQVLAWRDVFGPETRAQEDYRKVIGLLILATVEPDPAMPAALIGGLLRGFPGLVAAVQLSDDELQAIMNGLA